MPYRYDLDGNSFTNDCVSTLSDSQDASELVTYWLTSAKYDWETMKVLYENGQYAYTLFFGHLVLEKILKAYYVYREHRTAPFTHSLTQLAAKLPKGELTLTEREIKLLREVSEFNVRARYPDRKYEFYKKCTKSYTSRYYRAITRLFEKLCHKLKQKK